MNQNNPATPRNFRLHRSPVVGLGLVFQPVALGVFCWPNLGSLTLDVSHGSILFSHWEPSCRSQHPLLCSSDASLSLEASAVICLHFVSVDSSLICHTSSQESVKNFSLPSPFSELRSVLYFPHRVQFSFLIFPGSWGFSSLFLFFPKLLYYSISVGIQNLEDIDLWLVTTLPSSRKSYFGLEEHKKGAEWKEVCEQRVRNMALGRPQSEYAGRRGTEGSMAPVQL